ncbi:sensor histidine kinase [Quadrisphaera sp. INWT6]|uniref:sensor histidine kinase n=1 Tax=Quadrisphaera sp. INWT6 TaxID=2596917 RepID=UPI00189247AC|nr:histidine kinase [Quadrisphaera sp. INWT6]MBF5081297.1 sensor histidine kinase [Quadrisphaera sp. INWT6]
MDHGSRAERLRSLAGAHPRLVDAGWALLWLLPLCPEAYLQSGVAGSWAALVTAVPLVWARRAPLAAALAVCALAVPSWLLLDGRPAYPGVLVLVALLGLASQRRGAALRAGVTAAVVVLLVLAAADRVARGGGTPPTTVWAAPAVTGPLLAAAVFAGVAARGRRERLAHAEERARRLEAERDHRAQIAVVAERARIARELHDVVAHALTVVVRLGDGMASRAARAPQAPADPAALDAVTTTARQALAEMRHLLGVLGDDADGGAAVTPLPGTPSAGGATGHDALDALVSGVRAAGVPVRLTRHGSDGGWSPAVHLAVHRIATEALTNVLDHAGLGARVEVLVRTEGDRVEVVVQDDGVGLGVTTDPEAPAAPGRGSGVAGMRERAASLGGRLDAGPREGGGWRVRAVLPSRPVTAP